MQRRLSPGHGTEPGLHAMAARGPTTHSARTKAV